MPNLLPAALLTELLKRTHSGFPLVDLYLPSATRRLGLFPVSVVGRGQYLPRLADMGPVRRVLNRLTGSIEFSPTRITITDTDYSFVRELGGAFGHQVRGSRAVILLCSTNVLLASWATRFDGFVDTWEKEGPCRWTLVLQPKDAPYRASFPKTQMLASDFPHAGDKTIYGHWGTLVYGIHDSRGSSDAGMVPAPFTNTILNRYGDWIGHVVVDRVYKNGTLQSASTYTIVRPTINGRKWTFVQFNSALAAGDVVSADLAGYDSNADGTGSLLTGTDALLHLLVNFVFGDYQSGSWASASGLPFSTASFTAAQTWLTARSWQKASRLYGGASQASGALAVQEFCSTKRLYPFFSPDGKLSLAFSDHATSTLWHSGSRFYRWDVDAREPYTPAGERSALCDRVVARYLFDAVKGDFAQQLEVRDVALTEAAPAELLLHWGHHSLAA